MMIKNLALICVLMLGIWSCSKSDELTPNQLPTDEVLNQLPSIPELLSPTNNLLCIDNVIDFQWSTANDPDDDTVSYQIEVSKDIQFRIIDHTTSISGTRQTFTLEKGVAYYWRVKASDAEKSKSQFSPAFGFYTESEAFVNHLPFSPTLVSPALDSLLKTTSAKLEWNASDVDTDDQLKFDIYFGTENPPKIVIREGFNELSVDTDIYPNETYYWQIVVKDDKGGETVGQIWNFSTQ